MSQSLRQRCANSLGVTYRAHSCCGVPGFGLARGLFGVPALPQECARHVPVAQTALRELAWCDIPGTLLLRSARFTAQRLNWGKK